MREGELFGGNMSGGKCPRAGNGSFRHVAMTTGRLRTLSAKISSAACSTSGTRRGDWRCLIID